MAIVINNTSVHKNELLSGVNDSLKYCLLFLINTTNNTTSSSSIKSFCCHNVPKELAKV